MNKAQKDMLLVRLEDMIDALMDDYYSWDDIIADEELEWDDIHFFLQQEVHVEVVLND